MASAIHQGRRSGLAWLAVGAFVVAASWGGAVAQCPSGQYGDAASCVDCSAGRYAPGNSTACSLCPKGHYSLRAAPTCIACDAGTYSGKCMFIVSSWNLVRTPSLAWVHRQLPKKATILSSALFRLTTGNRGRSTPCTDKCLPGTQAPAG